jgi:hypothetical protein
MHLISLSAAEQQDEKIFAALTAPLFIDVYGNLYALRSDGATTCIARPGSRDRVRFFRPCTDKMHKWVATNEKIYFLINGNRRFLIQPAAGSFRYTDIVPQYSPIFSLHGPSEAVGVSSLNGLACIKLSDDPTAFGVHPTMYALAGWVNAGSGYMSGVDRLRGPKGAGHERGEAWIARFDLQSEKLMGLDKAALASEGMAALLTKVYPLGGRTSFAVECWLDAVSSSDQPLLVGGVVDLGLFEDEWMLTKIPSDTDFNILVLAHYAGGRLEPKAVLYPYRFRQSVTVGQEAFLYLTYSDRSVGTTDVSSLRVVHVDGRGSIGEPRALHFLGLDSTLPVSFLDFHYDQHIGFYGCLALTRTFASHDCYLCRSDDGIDWTVVHPLQCS